MAARLTGRTFKAGFRFGSVRDTSKKQNTVERTRTHDSVRSIGLTVHSISDAEGMPTTYMTLLSA